jgi:hypothetical protein
MRRARPIGELVGEAMRGLRRRPAAASPEALQEAWARAAGAPAAAASRVVGWRAGVLTVATDSPALRSELVSFRKPELLERLREELPVTVSDLSVRLGG